MLAPLALRRPTIVAEVWRDHRWEALGVAVLSPLAYVMVLTAMQFTPVSLVAPTREISILIGTLLGSREAVVYLFIGQAVMATVTECFMAIPSTTWERRAGTLALLIAAPGPLWPVFVGRSLQWLPSGVATGTIVLLAVGPFFGVTWSPWAALLLVPALAVVAASMYAVALTLSAVVLRGPRWRNVVSNVSSLVVMLLSGATVPVTMWPSWLQAVGQVLPVTHALEAIRLLQEQGVVGAAWPLLGLALLLGLGWFVLAAAAFTLFGKAGRRAGTIDFDE